MSGSPAYSPPPRYAPLRPQTWPQDTLRTPKYSGPGMSMPAVSQANAEKARQESFTYSSTFVLPTTQIGGVPLQQTILTDPDGDFWADQIYMVGWGNLMGPNNTQSGFPFVGRLLITDQRTGRSLGGNINQTMQAAAPFAGTPSYFFATLVLFAYDTGITIGDSPYPDGFRSTSTIAQPFCFTRSGGIVLTFYPAAGWAGITVGQQLIDISFGGWKEYENAS